MFYTDSILRLNVSLGTLLSSNRVYDASFCVYMKMPNQKQFCQAACLELNQSHGWTKKDLKGI